MAIYSQVFQMAYIVRDIELAIEAFSQRYDVSDFLRSGVFSLAPSGAEPMRLALALAFMGETLIELIQPCGGADQLYSRFLPEVGNPMRFHHSAFRIWSDAEWDLLINDIQRRKHKIVMQGEMSNTKFLYIDTMQDLGHYTEYLYYLDPENSSLPRIPQNRH